MLAYLLVFTSINGAGFGAFLGMKSSLYSFGILLS